MVYLVQDRDRVGTWIKEAPPIWTRPQRRENDPSLSLKVANNMRNWLPGARFPEGSKLHVVINGQFDYDGGSRDAHG